MWIRQLAAPFPAMVVHSLRPICAKSLPDGRYLTRRLSLRNSVRRKHNLQTERFFKPVMINNMMAIGDGPIKTFPLRGIKDSPPYMHDGRLLTLEDTVEFFNLILSTKLTTQEKQDLVAFMRTLSRRLSSKYTETYD